MRSARALLLIAASCGRLHFDDLHDAAATVGTDVVALDAYAGPNRAFVSSTVTTGDFGFAGGDAMCQALADAAGLDGEFVALLWDQANTPPSSRLTGARGWVDPIGRPIADQPTDFDTAATLNPINHDETGQLVDDTAWTGHGGLSCADWTTQAGIGIAAETYGMLYVATPDNSGCAATWHLNCVERGRSVPVTPVVATGRIAFVSETYFQSGGGLASADALCNSEASAAGLPGTYLAWLGSSAGDPELRFTLGGLPWRRVDGVLLGPTDDVMLSTDHTIYLDSFINKTASGGNWSGLPAWTGAMNMHCMDWTSTSGAGMQGVPGTTHRLELEEGFPSICGIMGPLICLEL